MATLFVFILLLFVILFYQLGQKQLAKICFIMCACLFLLVGSGVIAVGLIDYLESPYYKSSEKISWGKSNGIILLGAGNVKLPTSLVKPSVFSYSRISQAALLYFNCKKNSEHCLLILSGGDPSKCGKSEAQASKDELVALGVNKKDIVMESKSINTYRNAELTSQIIRSKNFDKLYLVSSGIHLRRAELYFSNFGIKPEPILADFITPQISFIPLGYNFAISDFALHEYFGMVRFYVYNFFGWNAKANLPGTI